MRQKQRVFSLFLLSPSSRRAWIEMWLNEKGRVWVCVAHLAEGVDRNFQQRCTLEGAACRPPRGGRG